MTDGLSHQLWRLSEAGEPVVMLGRQHAVGEEAAFERLLQLGILLHRGRESSWDVCADCDCGADEREVLWDGDVATAKCAADRRRDEHLDADDVRSFSVDVHAFMDGVATSMGLGRAELVAPGLWSLGMLADGRIIVAAPTRAGIRQPGLVGAIRLTHKEGTIVLVGPELPALTRDAETAMARVRSEATDLLRSHRGTHATALFGRYAENTAKLAMIAAVSRDPARPITEVHDVTWASALVEHCIGTLLREAERLVSDNDTEANHKRVLEIIRAAGEISRNALVRKTQFLSKREREEIFDALVEGELVARSVKQTGTRPTMLFTACGTPEAAEGKEASP